MASAASKRTNEPIIAEQRVRSRTEGFLNRPLHRLPCLFTIQPMIQPSRDEDQAHDGEHWRRDRTNLGLMPCSPAVLAAIGLAISWANMGLPEAALDLPDAGKIVERFGVEPFLESQ